MMLVWVLLTHTSDVMLACGAAVVFGGSLFLMGWTALLIATMK